MTPHDPRGPRRPTVHAVLHDDALLDALAAGRRPAASAADEPVVDVLSAWRDAVTAAPLPAPPPRSAVRRLARAVGLRRPGVSHTARAATGIAVAATLLLGGTAVAGSRSAQPGDLLFGVTRVLWSDRADSALAERDVTAALDRARVLRAAGDDEGARGALAEAARLLPRVRTEDRGRVQAQLADAGPTEAPPVTRRGREVPVAGAPVAGPAGGTALPAAGTTAPAPATVPSASTTPAGPTTSPGSTGGTGSTAPVTSPGWSAGSASGGPAAPTGSTAAPSSSTTGSGTSGSAAPTTGSGPASSTGAASSGPSSSSGSSGSSAPAPTTSAGSGASGSPAPTTGSTPASSSPSTSSAPSTASPTTTSSSRRAELAPPATTAPTPSTTVTRPGRGTPTPVPTTARRPG